MANWYKITPTKVVNLDTVIMFIYNKKEGYIDAVLHHGEYVKLYNINEEQYQALADKVCDPSIKGWSNHDIEKMQNALKQAEAIVEAISDILDDEEPSDFMLSFPIVHEVYDLKKRKE